MIRVKLTSILVNDQARARAFYAEKLGFEIKHDLPCGDVFFLTLTAPDDLNGIELLLEPNTGVPEAKAMTEALYARDIPQAQLYTADIAAEYAALKAKGVAFKAPPAQMGTTLYADFDDTCGNWIRLVQEPYQTRVHDSGKVLMDVKEALEMLDEEYDRKKLGLDPR